VNKINKTNEINKKKEIRTFVLNREEKEAIINTISRVLSKEEVIILAFLYGSFLEDGAFRDIDIGVFIKREEPLSPFFEFELEEKLSKTIPPGIPIEVRVVNKAPVTFLYHVITGKLLVCKDRECFANIVTTVARRYQDLEPVLEHYTKEAYNETGKQG